MVSHSLSLEAILVSAIGLILLLLIVGVLAFVALVPDQKTTPDLDSETN